MRNTRNNIQVNKPRKILLLLGWRTTKGIDEKLLSESLNIDTSVLSYPLVCYFDEKHKAEYFGIELAQIDEYDMGGSNSINYLDVSEKYGAMFDILASKKIHIDYKIGRPRVWVIIK